MNSKDEHFNGVARCPDSKGTKCELRKGGVDVTKKQLCSIVLVVGVCFAMAAPAVADVGGGGNPSYCACIACGATCQFVWGTPMCFGTGNPYDACYYCMFGCSNGGATCCTGPPTW